jgi:hypothetical protein
MMFIAVFAGHSIAIVFVSTVVTTGNVEGNEAWTI